MCLQGRARVHGHATWRGGSTRRAWRDRRDGRSEVTPLESELRYHGEARIREVSLQNARPDGHAERAGWILPAKWCVRALARDLADTPTPIIEAAALDMSRQDNTIRINTLAISDHYPSMSSLKIGREDIDPINVFS